MRKILQNMKKILFIVAFAIAPVIITKSFSINIKDDLKALDNALSSRPVIESQKRVKIDSLYQAAAISNMAYDAYYWLYKEYRSYNYDTALIYVDFMERVAAPWQLPEVELCRAFVYLSGGLFKEASDILSSWRERHMDVVDRKLLFTYRTMYARLQWDMADNAGGKIGEYYNKIGLETNDQIIQSLSTQDTVYYWYALAITDLREGNYARSIARCKVSLEASPASIHEQAVTASTLAYLYRLTNEPEKALHYYIEAAICDILSSTYETVALRNMAELLFEAGETDLADRYIHIAMHDAQRYHARHRQVDIAQSLPIIEEKMMSRIRSQQYMTFILLIVVAVLLLIGIIGIIILVRQNRALTNAQETIDRMNGSLTEANKLKEQLLGTLLSSRAKYINAVKQYQQDVKQHAAYRQWNALFSIPKDADARIQRVVLDHQIDTIFLSIYPTFIEDFNSLLRPEEQFVLKKDELLNTQLRIFALIRLGITHNEVIAEILDYSINTVYSYKTRVIASSKMKADEFYSSLMQIPSFSSTPV